MLSSSLLVLLFGLLCTHTLAFDKVFTWPSHQHSSADGCYTCNDASRSDDGKQYPQVIQSIPVGFNTTVNLTSTEDAWIAMLNSARRNVSICAFYMTLTQGATQYPSISGGSKGLAVFNAIVAAAKRNVTVRVVIGWPPLDDEGNDDPSALEKVGVIVQRLNWPKSTNLTGVLHAKFMTVDERASYVGSANFDWRSLSQVKELGLVIKECPALTSDLQLIFEQYWWLASGNHSVPNTWPIQYWGDYDKSRPLLIGSNGTKIASFIAVSPPSFCPPTRTHDDDALLDVFRTASEYVKLSVMDYAPFYLYSDVQTLWPDLDDEIRLAALRGVKISFILALWNHTVLRTVPYLQSLAVLPNVDVRLLIVPPGPGPTIPFTRVDHSKYAISESRYYITTSNWTPDYFESTAGVSLTMISNVDNWVDMDSTFDADWNSPYTVPIFQRFPPDASVFKKGKKH